ncbi:MAG: NTP transferase domain-containing protein [Spirochaetaceae bacterium]|jgi:mannose-1-phosphate guanylyltransferase/mannose-6-phosphate isomerase|nr:NTP transferase domain-containing protein [Spirochaetaceae bacterium]
MIIIIIAGGSGTRLWPLSSPGYPKHLLSLAGEGTLLQQSYERAKSAGDEVYIVSERSHASYIEKQLPEIPASNILIEPERRGTANCLLFALDSLERRHKNDEPITFIHCDHIVKNTKGFAESLKKAARLALENQKIVLCGVKPDYASSALGYIEAGEKQGEAYTVKSFKEKPDTESAQKYLEAGNFFWNTGYFTASVDIFCKEIQKYSPEMFSNLKSLQCVKDPLSLAYNTIYLSFKSAAVDYLLMEKDPELLMIPAEFDWADVGNFKDLDKIMPKDSSGNYLRGNRIYTLDSSNLFIRNEEEKPVTVIGMDNIVVVNTANGILVSSKDSVHKVGEIAKQLQGKN